MRVIEVSHGHPLYAFEAAHLVRHWMEPQPGSRARGKRLSPIRDGSLMSAS